MQLQMPNPDVRTFGCGRAHSAYAISTPRSRRYRASQICSTRRQSFRTTHPSKTSGISTRVRNALTTRLENRRRDTSGIRRDVVKPPGFGKGLSLIFGRRWASLNRWGQALGQKSPPDLLNFQRRNSRPGEAFRAVLPSTRLRLDGPGLGVNACEILGIVALAAALAGCAASRQSGRSAR